MLVMKEDTTVHSREKLEVHSIERMYLQQKCSDGSRWNKTILKARIAAAAGSQYIYVGFFRCNKIPCCSAYTISEKAMWFRHPVYNADRAENLISCPCPNICRHATFHANPCTRFCII